MTERAKHWRALMREQKRSGLTQAEFCRQRQINPGTFAWWRRKLRVDSGAEPASVAVVHAATTPRVRNAGKPRRRPGRTASRTVPLGFMEVGVVAAGPHRYEIDLPGGRVVRVPADFDPEHVTRLILAVEAAC